MNQQVAAQGTLSHRFVPGMQIVDSSEKVLGKLTRVWIEGTEIWGAVNEAMGVNLGESVEVVDLTGHARAQNPALEASYVRLAVNASRRNLITAADQSAPIKPHAVIRFKHAIDFPRFSMAAGERWGFVAVKANAERLAAIKAGERFDFAGGQCLAEDVEVIYEGAGGIDYARAAGYIK